MRRRRSSGVRFCFSRHILPDHGNLIDWLARQIEKLGVEVKLQRAGTLADVRKLSPHAVVVATGASSGYLWADKQNFNAPQFDVYTALERPLSEWRGHIAVLGGDVASCQVALHVAKSGAHAHVIESSAGFAVGKPQLTGMLLTEQMRAQGNIHLHPETTAETLTGNRVITQTRGAIAELEITAVVVGGRAPNIDLSEALQQAEISAAVYTIGDAMRARDVYWASYEAAEVAEKIWLSTRRPVAA